MSTTPNYQDLFFQPEGIYALSHSVGPLTKHAQHALQASYLEPWANFGGDAWPNWLSEVEHFCQTIAELIGAKNVGASTEICPQPNLSAGFSAFLSAIAKLPKHKHQRVILMHEDAFASMGFVVQGLATAYQLELVLIKGHANDVNIWYDAFEQHAVLACLVTHVHSNTSVVSDVEKICSIAKQFEAFALVDIAQSIGIMPVDVKHWRADAVFGSCVKWLCGGPGAGFMYINSNLVGYLQPDPVGWFSHQNPFEFDIRHYQAHDNSKRFWGGTPSIAPYVMANASIKVLHQLGFDLIRKHNQLLKQTLYQHIQNNIMIRSNEMDIEKCGGSLCVAPKNLSATIKHLRTAQVKFDQRRDIVRISMHINNTLKDVDVISNCFKQS